MLGQLGLLAGSQLEDGLIHSWSLDGNSTDVFTTGNGTDTAVTYLPKIGTKCASFNGTTSNVQTAVDGPLGAAARSISCWIMPTSAAAYGCILGYGTVSANHGFELSYYAGGVNVFTGDANVATKGCSANVWSHAVATYDGTTCIVYVNGSSNSQVYAMDTTHAATYARFGQGVRGSFLGHIDDTCMWDRALTSGEVASLYNSGTGVETMTGSLLTGLLHQWHLNGDSVDSVDGSGNGTDTAVAYSPKLGSGCAAFNGTGSKIQTAIDGPLGASPRSVSMWLNKASAANRNAFGYGIQLSGQSFDVLYFGGMCIYDTGATSSPQAMSTGVWHHFAATYNGTTVQTYLDGVAGTPWVHTLNTVSSTPINIGTGVHSSFAWWDGLIDDVQLSSRAWTSTEVASLYNAGAGRYYPF